MVWMKVPYTNFHNLNQDWIIHRMMEFEEYMQNIVQISVIKYADPIQWRITGQYEQSTVVIDAETGIAYISVQPVPAGVAITNTNYWTPVFDLQQILGDINERIDDEERARIAADDALATADTTLQANIDAEAAARTAADTTLQDNIDAEIRDREAADLRIEQEITDHIQFASIYINVKEYGATGDGSTDDSDAIIDALAAAGDDKSTVFFPNGTYCVTKPIRIYSNTKLLFDMKAVIKVKRTDSSFMGLTLCLGEYGNSAFATGYNGVHDVIFENMQFDLGYFSGFSSSSHGGGNIGASHCRNLKFTGCTFYNSANEHYVDIAGCENVYFSGCTFTGGYYVATNSDTPSFEAVNIDWSSSTGFPHFGVADDTACRDIRFISCRFENFNEYGAFGIGNHGIRPTTSAANIQGVNIQGCTFYNMQRAIWLNSTDGIVINDNDFDTVSQFMDGASNPYAIRLRETDKVILSGNTFRNLYYHGMIIQTGSEEKRPRDIAITGNVFSGIGNEDRQSIAIRLINTDDVLVTGNIFRNVSSQIVYATTSDRIAINGNNIRSCPGILVRLQTVPVFSMIDNTITDSGTERSLSSASGIYRNNNETTFTTV